MINLVARKINNIKKIYILIKNKKNYYSNKSLIEQKKN